VLPFLKLLRTISQPLMAGQDSGSCLYLFSITVTMAVALTMLVLLLTMKRALSRFTLFFSYQRIALFYIKVMLASLALGVATSFIIGTYIHGSGRSTYYSCLLPCLPPYSFDWLPYYVLLVECPCVATVFFKF
jgi:hypothetical protein